MNGLVESLFFGGGGGASGSKGGGLKHTPHSLREAPSVHATNVRAQCWQVRSTGCTGSPRGDVGLNLDVVQVHGSGGCTHALDEERASTSDPGRTSRDVRGVCGNG